MQIKKVFRQERKFLISGEQYYRFSRQFSELFKEESHNGKDGYMVRSLYFDTLGNKDFEEKLAGVECRRKMRLRIYSPQSRTALLEMTPLSRPSSTTPRSAPSRSRHSL